MGRQMGLQRTGNLDIVYDMQPGHQDPDYAAFYDQVKIFKHFVGQWPEALKRDLEKSWQQHQDRLAQAARPGRSPEDQWLLCNATSVRKSGVQSP